MKISSDIQEPEITANQADERRGTIVIGAGPAGLTAAYSLAKRGLPVSVFEASEHVGGMARSMELWGQIVDLGPHRFFSESRQINELWLEAVDGDYEMVNRCTRILYGGSFFDYPLRAGNALAKLGPITSARCVLSYLKEKIAPTPDAATFESWVVRRFGRRLYEIFFKAYSEKLWGRPCSELHSDFASQRIKKFSLGEAIKNALGKKRSHATLVDHFAYPRKGCGAVYQNMRHRIEEWGGHVNLQTPIESVSIRNGRAQGVSLANGQFVKSQAVISSMPLTLLIERLNEAPEKVKHAASQLRFRNTVLVYLRINGALGFKDNWIYIHEPSLECGRITNFRNWSSAINRGESDTILALEFWADNNDPRWRRTNEGWISIAKAEAAHSGLVKTRDILDGQVIRVPRCYPVYSRDYKKHLAPIAEYLSGIQGLQVIGRYGAFKYNNQDHSILMGMLAAENIADGAGHDIWGVNTDYGTYQESARITETGLVAD